MSLAQQVAALRALFGTPADEAMNLAMGIIGEGPLPARGVKKMTLSGSWMCGGCGRVRG